MLSRRGLIGGAGAALALGLMPDRLAAAPLAKVKALGTIRVVVYQNNRPWSWEEGGKLVGLDVDLAQAIARPVRDQSGQPVPTFTQGEESVPGALFGFVRAGWSNFDDAPRAGLQRVAYVLEGGALKRLSWPMLDGAAPTEAAVLLEDVASAKVEFRDNTGAWRDDWTAADADALPRAVALNVNLVGKPAQRMLFLVGPQTRVALPSVEKDAAE